MQVLFVWDANAADDLATARQVVEGGSDDEGLRADAIEMASGAWMLRDTIDPRIERIAPQWPPRRQPGVDRALIRLAVWEMTRAGTPPKIAINEAVELAKHFSTEQSASFVNGVLDAVMQEVATIGSGIRGTIPGSASSVQEEHSPDGSTQFPSQEAALLVSAPAHALDPEEGSTESEARTEQSDLNPPPTLNPEP